MNILTFLITLLCSQHVQVQAKAVFAHFMVGNVASWSVDRWKTDIGIAAKAHIDAFALNIAYNDSSVATSVSRAFQAAQGTGFKLFFSFDYAGGGAWPAGDVRQYLSSYIGNGAYFRTQSGKPFVSTFEGPDSANDWVSIKADYGVFFMPDWSSKGAGPAAALAGGVADGLFSWAAWPWGNQDMNTYVDAAYLQVLGNSSDGGKPYMMPVSPMFYTNLPGYDKNWLWRGDNLWYDRWQQVLFLQPDYVEIISWNDWGECHYIGPLDPAQYDAVFKPGKAAYNYVEGFPHDNWLLLLPHYIDLYKTGRSTYNTEYLTIWSRSTALNTPGCSTNGTSGNTATQLQLEFFPDQVVEDRIFYSALLVNPADILLMIGGVAHEDATWTHTPPGGYTAGFYHGSYPYSGPAGDVIMTLLRGEEGASVMFAETYFYDHCVDGIMNYNMGVGQGRNEFDLGLVLEIEDWVCIEGTSVAGFSDLCQWTCARGYCPPSACLCTKIGPLPPQHPSPGTLGYPAANATVVYEGLCMFACGRGYCPSAYCGTVKVPVPTPTISPFNPLTCISGDGIAFFSDLCRWSCAYGYCPVAACGCSATGVLVQPPDANPAIKAKFVPVPGVMAYDDLCTWTCSRGHCPEACSSNLACVSGGGEGNFGGLCSFSCGRGFCPPPCICHAFGSVGTVPGYLPNVVGFGNGGLDDTYDALCNFTCSHGYCPDGACSQSIGVPTESQPLFTTMTGLIPLATGSGPHKPGDSFEYTLQGNHDLSLDVVLVKGPRSFDDATCANAPVVAGTEGGFLGCVAQAAAWMTYSVYQSGGAEETTPVRRDLLSALHRFQSHAEWQPTGNCSSVRCMLLSGTPERTWVSVGNGTYNGTFHELHFIRSGSMVGHRVWPGGFPNSSAKSDNALAARQYYLADPYPSQKVLRLDWYTDTPKDHYNSFYERDAAGPIDVSNSIGTALENTIALTSYQEYCVGMAIEGSVTEMGLWNVGNASPTRLDDAISLEQAEGDLRGCSLPGAVIVCYSNATAIDESLQSDSFGSVNYPFLFRRLLSWTKRAGGPTSGASETYMVEDVLGNNPDLPFVAPTYPNGDNGAALARENGDNRVYALRNTGNCLDGSLVDDAPTTGPNRIDAVTEHVNERVNGRNFLDFVQDPVIDLHDGNGPRRSNIPPVPFVTLRDWAAVPYAQWPQLHNLPPGSGSSLPSQGSAFTDFADSFGSSTNPDVLTNLEEAINGYKARVEDTNVSPSADSVFDPLAENPTIANTQSALTLLRLGFATFNYLNDDFIQGLALNSYRDGLSAWQQFDELYNRFANPAVPTRMADHYTSFLTDGHPTRMVNVHRDYMNNRLDQLEAPWVNIQNSATSSLQQRQDANNARGLIAQMRAQIPNVVVYDPSFFHEPVRLLAKL